MERFINQAITKSTVSENYAILWFPLIKGVWKNFEKNDLKIPFLGLQAFVNSASKTETLIPNKRLLQLIHWLTSSIWNFIRVRAFTFNQWKRGLTANYKGKETTHFRHDKCLLLVFSSRVWYCNSCQIDQRGMNKYSMHAELPKKQNTEEVSFWAEFIALETSRTVLALGASSISIHPDPLSLPPALQQIIVYLSQLQRTRKLLYTIFGSCVAIAVVPTKFEL